MSVRIELMLTLIHQALFETLNFGRSLSKN